LPYCLHLALGYAVNWHGLPANVAAEHDPAHGCAPSWPWPRPQARAPGKLRGLE
jgi:hypothetical protein